MKKLYGCSVEHLCRPRILRHNKILDKKGQHFGKCDPKSLVLCPCYHKQQNQKSLKEKYQDGKVQPTFTLRDRTTERFLCIAFSSEVRQKTMVLNEGHFYVYLVHIRQRLSRDTRTCYSLHIKLKGIKNRQYVLV